MALMLLGSVSNALGQSFAPFVAYSSGTYVIPYDIDLADVNGDTKPDIIMAGGGSNAIGVLLNMGAGTFQSVIRYSTGGGSYPAAVATGDVNSDGKLDLVSANYLGNSVGVLLGNGDGTFQTVTIYSTGTYSAPSDVAVGDVNYDGKPDIITANYNNSTLGLFINTGRSFQLMVPYAAGTGCNPSSIVAADVNGDGKADLIAGNQFGGAVSVLLNDGYGSFNPVVLYNTSPGDHTYNVAVADLNGDRKPDIVTANANNNSVGIMLGNGNGTFQTMATQVIGPNQYGYDVAVADITGDNKPDLLAVNGSYDAAEVLPGNGNGTFQPFKSFSTGSRSAPNTVAVADLNGDNKLDIVTGNNDNNTISVLLNTTASVLASQPISPQTQLGLWPNPCAATEGFTLTMSGLPTRTSRLEATFFNTAGQRLSSAVLPITQGTVQGKLPTTGFLPGLYILRLSTYDMQGTYVSSLAVRQVCIK
ncbi:VCBS repeat-containing protein [Hymenobacter sp. RP-2-7]|uniref:VCBS repeat-containing protein n=1 Tax=Hymenobacter polaris TaxID=2682546 RepID=A0A7Y0FMP6_9BACT|nr:VCBS repeat-containing protein [Hymenobacter polaris]NML65655.1 VCBS repeat-containing protein [Hymenobacter polaris]